MYLVGCTRLDPMTYVLFGAYNLEASNDSGLICDDWIPLRGNSDVLDDIRSLKLLMESCMLRVFEGANSLDGSRRKRMTRGAYVPPFRRQNRDNEESESGAEDEDEDLVAERGRNRGPLSQKEIKELDRFTHGIVQVLNRFADERMQSRSRYNSRPATPIGSGGTPTMAGRSLPPIDGNVRSLPPLEGAWRSGTSTPSRFDSRPPSRLGPGR